MSLTKEEYEELYKGLYNCMDKIRRVLKTVSSKNFDYADELALQRGVVVICYEAFPNVTEKLYWLLEEVEEQLTDIVVKTGFWLEMLSKLKVELRKMEVKKDAVN